MTDMKSIAIICYDVACNCDVWYICRMSTGYPIGAVPFYCITDDDCGCVEAPDPLMGIILYSVVLYDRRIVAVVAAYPSCPACDCVIFDQILRDCER